MREFQTDIKESSVSTRKAKYLFEMKRLLTLLGFTTSYCKGSSDDPFLLTNFFDVTYHLTVQNLAIVNRIDKRLLKENSGPIELTSVWAKSLLQWINFVKRKATTSVKVEPSHFNEPKEQSLLDIKAVVDIENVPSDLILNWDYTGINVVPGSQWTMEAKGSKRVEAAGVNDKWQITALLCAALSGELLPLQLIYQGKTAACLPRFVFPPEWNVTFTPNHWSNEQKTKEYIKIILSYVAEKCKAHGRPNQTALAIFDEFKGQVTDDVYNMLD